MGKFTFAPTAPENSGAEPGGTKDVGVGVVVVVVLVPVTEVIVESVVIVVSVAIVVELDEELAAVEGFGLVDGRFGVVGPPKIVSVKVTSAPGSKAPSVDPVLKPLSGATVPEVSVVAPVPPTGVPVLSVVVEELLPALVVEPGAVAVEVPLTPSVFLAALGLGALL